jgi:hypothetical protein
MPRSSNAVAMPRVLVIPAAFSSWMIGNRRAALTFAWAVSCFRAAARAFWVRRPRAVIAIPSLCGSPVCVSFIRILPRKGGPTITRWPTPRCCSPPFATLSASATASRRRRDRHANHACFVRKRRFEAFWGSQSQPCSNLSGCGLPATCARGRVVKLPQPECAGIPSGDPRSATKTKG